MQVLQYPLDTERKIKVHRTLRRCLRRLIYVLYPSGNILYLTINLGKTLWNDMALNTNSGNKKVMERDICYARCLLALFGFLTSMKPYMGVSKCNSCHEVIMVMTWRSCILYIRFLGQYIYIHVILT